MAQEDFEGYKSRHLGNVIDAVVEWGKRYTNIDLQGDHNRLATAISDLAKVTEQFTSQFEKIQAILGDMEGNTYFDTQNSEGDLYIMDANSNSPGTLFVRDVVAQFSGSPIHRLTEKANQTDVNNLVTRVNGFSGLKDINIEDIDFGLEGATLPQNKYFAKLNEIAGVYRVIKSNGDGISSARFVVGILHVFGDEGKRNIYESLVSAGDPTGEYYYGAPHTFTRTFRTDNLTSVGIWSEWIDTEQDLVERVDALEVKTKTLDSQTTQNRTTLEALEVYGKVVYDEEWNGPFPTQQVSGDNEGTTIID